MQLVLNKNGIKLSIEDGLIKVKKDDQIQKIPVDKLDSIIMHKATSLTSDVVFKAKLPYFIGAKFENNLKKCDHFIQADWVILDLDNCINSPGDQDRIRKMLKNDKRIALLFVSPGGNGIKLVFRIKTPITNTQQFSNFYTAFTARFARKYKLEDVLDFTTKDATRVCFLSVDKDAFVNEQCKAVDPADYISQYDLLNTNMEIQDKSKNQEGKLTDEIYTEILQKLNPKTNKRKPEVYVPEALQAVVEPIIKQAGKLGIFVDNHIDIQYGKQITFKMENVFSQINLYYGKSGFSVVITAKNGSDRKFGELCKALIENVLYLPKNKARKKTACIERITRLATRDISLN